MIHQWRRRFAGRFDSHGDVDALGLSGCDGDGLGSEGREATGGCKDDVVALDEAVKLITAGRVSDAGAEGFALGAGQSDCSPGIIAPVWSATWPRRVAVGADGCAATSRWSSNLCPGCVGAVF